MDHIDGNRGVLEEVLFQFLFVILAEVKMEIKGNAKVFPNIC